MSTLRKLKKSTQASREPMILIVPNAKDTYIDFLKTQPGIITITDREIYDRMLEGVNQALQTNRPGVIKGG